MLRTNAPTPSIEREQVSAGDGELGEMVGTAWVFLRRQYPVILFCAILAIAVAAIYLLVAPPRYTAHTAVILDARKGQFFKEQSILADAPTDMTWVESRVKIVKSDNIAEAVIKTLHLTELPEFVGSGVDALDWLLGFVGASQRPPRSELELIRQAVDIFEKRLEVTRVAMSYVLDVSFISNDPVWSK